MSDRFIVLALTELELLRCIREAEPDASARVAYLAAHKAAYAKDAPKVQRPPANGSTAGRGRAKRRAATIAG